MYEVYRIIVCVITVRYQIIMSLLYRNFSLHNLLGTEGECNVMAGFTPDDYNFFVQTFFTI